MAADEDAVTHSMRVLIEGIWSIEYDGWAIAMRSYARALRSAGCEVSLLSTPGLVVDEPVEAVLREVEGMYLVPWATRPPKVDVHITSFCTRGPAEVREYLERTIRTNRERERDTVQVWYTMLERDRVAPEVAAAFDRFDRVWVTCDANRIAMVTSGVDPRKVTWIPYPYFDDDPFLALAARPTPSPRTFYWIGRWEPRKAPDRLLRAFLTAFRPGEARLTMKVTKPVRAYGDYPVSVHEALVGILEDSAVHNNGWRANDLEAGGLRILEARLSPVDIIALHRDHGTYVSPSLGEGIDLPSFAAKLAGNRLICTCSGGPNDFAGLGDIVIGRWAEASADVVSYGWEEGSRWCAYEIEDLVEALRRAAVSTEQVSLMGGRFRAKRVGEWMLDDLKCCKVGT